MLLVSVSAETDSQQENPNDAITTRPISDYTHLRDSCSHLYTTNLESEILNNNNNDQSYSGSLSGHRSYPTAEVASQSDNVYSQLEPEGTTPAADGSMGKFYVPESGSDGKIRWSLVKFPSYYSKFNTVYIYYEIMDSRLCNEWICMCQILYCLCMFVFLFLSQRIEFMLHNQDFLHNWTEHFFAGDVETDPNMDVKGKSYRKPSSAKELTRFTNATSSIESLDDDRGDDLTTSDDTKTASPHSRGEGQ